MDECRVGWDGGTTYGAIGVFSLSNKLGELNHIALKACLDKRHLGESEGGGGGRRDREEGRGGEREEREREGEGEREGGRMHVRMRNKETFPLLTNLLTN